MEYVALKPMIFVDLEVLGGSKLRSGISVGTLGESSQVS